jgi:hypothetical protein
MKTKKEINWYGSEDNYIHLKFGRAMKCYNFTTEFIEEYTDFAREYENYFEYRESKFENSFQIVSYVYAKKIPVHFYFNYTDTPAKNEKEIMEYLLRENTWSAEMGKSILKE